MNRRIALLIAAVVIAALGTSLVFAYVRSADERAVEAQEPVTVLVAKTQIAAGTRAADAANTGAFELKDLPAGAVPAGALSSIEPVRESVTLAPIFPGQTVLAPMFGATAAASTSLSLQPGQLAVSFQFGDPQRVAGFVQPGSNVVIFVTGGGDGGTPATRVLLPRATVIAVGPTTITPPADPSQANPEALPRALLTLALTQKDAERMIHAQSTGGSMYLGLLTDTSAVTADGGVSSGNLFAAAR